MRLADEGVIGLDWYKGKECKQRLPSTAPVLLIMHGITGAVTGKWLSNSGRMPHYNSIIDLSVGTQVTAEGRM